MPVTTTNTSPVPGGTQFLTLWLLLTTNKFFLSAPGETAAQAGLTTFDPVPGTGDTISTWKDIEGILTANNAQKAMFTTAQLQDLLLNQIHTSHIFDAQGHPTLSFAQVLANSHDVFQSLQSRFVNAWGRPSPTKMDEILK